MRRTLGLILLAAAWVVVIVGLEYDFLEIPFPGGPLPFGYLGVPLLGASLYLLVREMDRRDRPSE